MNDEPEKDFIEIPFEKLDLAIGALTVMNMAFLESEEGQAWLEQELKPEESS